MALLAEHLLVVTFLTPNPEAVERTYRGLWYWNVKTSRRITEGRPSAQPSQKYEFLVGSGRERFRLAGALTFKLDAAPQAQPPFHATVPRIYRFAIHQRTTADNTIDAVHITLADRLFRNAPLTERPMEPY